VKLQNKNLAELCTIELKAATSIVYYHP